MVEKDRIDGNKYKSVRKSENKIVKIFTKSKYWNLPKSKSRNLFKSKKTQNANAMREPNFLPFKIRIIWF